MISGIGREVRSPSGRPISNVVQTNAAIHPPENSGYPLLDGSGRMILMATGDILPERRVRRGWDLPRPPTLRDTSSRC